MDPLGNNKIYAAILGSALVFMMIRMLPEVFMHSESPKVPAYIIGDVGGEAEEVEVELPFPQADWIAAMDAERGARVFKNCTSCHNAEKGGPNGTGPGLWNVVGAQPGQHAGFAYSDAMSSVDYVWGFEELDAFLEKPKSYLPGTKMNFVGIRKESDRAAVIEYMRLAADNPLPQPTPAAAAVELTADAETATIPTEDIVVQEDPAAENPIVDGSEALPTDADAAAAEQDAADAEGSLLEAIEDVVTEAAEEAEILTQEEKDEAE